MRPLLPIAILSAVLALAAPASASPNAYIAQGPVKSGVSAHALTVFDVATGAQVTSIDLPSPALDVAIDPTGARAYVTTSTGLSVVDLATNSVVTSIPGGSGSDVAMDPSGKRVYVADGGNKITLVDTATNTVTGAITLTGQQVRAVVANADGTRAYTGNTKMSPYSVSIVDLTTDMQISELASGNFNRPESLGILPGGSKVYAANFGQSAGGTTVAILDVATNNVGSVTVGSSPTAAVVNPAGTKVYVANRDSQSISVIDVPSATVTGTFPLPFSPTEIAITPDGTRAALSSVQDQKVAFIDLGSGQVYSGPTDLPGSGGAAIAPAQPPVPEFSVTSGLSGEPASFDASASTGGPIARYDWDFGDGSAAPNGGGQVSHTYTAAGTYQATVTEINTCDPTAVYGTQNVVFAGHSPYCRGDRRSAKTVPVTIPAVAIGVVQTDKATLGKKGVVGLRVACIKELDCAGTLSLRTAGKVKVGKRPRRRVALGSKRFSTVRAGHTRRIALKLSRTGVRVVRSRPKLTAVATVSVTNPFAPARVRTHQVVLKRG
jgi:YVTN family beta-propeller protein